MQMRRPGHRGVCPLQVFPQLQPCRLSGRGHSNPQGLSPTQPASRHQGARKRKQFLPEHPVLSPQGSDGQASGELVTTPKIPIVVFPLTQSSRCLLEPEARSREATMDLDSHTSFLLFFPHSRQ